MSVELKIKIDKENLRRTMWCHGDTWESCSVADEIRKIFPHAAVGAKLIWPHYGIKKKGQYSLQYPIELPPEAINFIWNWDNTRIYDRPNLPEIEFSIFLPDELIATINIDEVKSIIEKTPSLELV